MRCDKLPYRIRLYIKKSKANVFVLADFSDFISDHDYDQVLRVLRNMVRSNELIKIGHGIYAKTKTYANGKTLPIGSIGDLAREALKKLGVKVDNSTYWNAYNANQTTQVPNGRVIAVDRRVRRKIGYNGYGINYEFMGKRYNSLWYNDPKLTRGIK